MTLTTPPSASQYVRVSLLVNVWVGHKTSEAQPLQAGPRPPS